MQENTHDLFGLTDAEVAQRKASGLQNNYEENVAKSTKDIIKDNIFTLFNLLNLIIGICLALVGAFSNMFFMVIIIMNIVIGISQEIHARNLIAKLSIVNKEKVTVLREGKAIKIASEELVMEDIVRLSAGDQVPTDLVLLKGNPEVNEALLTGESDLIDKQIGDTLLSGSFLSSGQCFGKVIHVGKDNYAIRIANEAKIHKPTRSELVDSIRKVAKFTSYVIIPLGIVLFAEGLFIRHLGVKSAVVSSAAALLGMLPKGMVLLISIALATAVIKLANKKILVQDMYSVETLAHVDVICLDKTGTITEGKMKVQYIDLLNGNYQEEFKDIIGSYLRESTDNNITMQAIRNHFTESSKYEVEAVVPFSSERKWGAMKIKDLGVVALGAPERILKANQIPERVTSGQEDGLRVLMMGISGTAELTEESLPDLEPLALIEIDDPIRQNAEETLDYLKAEGVDIKVISGDNPVTVANVARRAGVEDYQSYIDLSTLKTEDEVRAAVNQYRIFGRVSPQQKRILVRELKDQGHTVAMTGDGVNDVLALKESDCSIAMAEGDSATRQVANLVLLESDFTTLPDVLFEGRRVVNNVTKVASIFFIKTIYSFILSILCGLTAIAFPFIPIQITLIDLAIEGYPTFFLSFESDRRKINYKFLPTALKNALPNALLVVFNVLVVFAVGHMYQWNNVETTTLMYYLLIAVSCMAVIKACLPFNPMRVFLAVTTVVGTYVAAWLFQGLLEINTLTSATLPWFIVLVVFSGVVKLVVEKWNKRKLATV